MNWQPIETAPKDGTLIVGFCCHEADPHWLDEKRLTLYAAHAEGLSHVSDGAHVLVWGGAFDDSTWEEPGASLPDWWFRFGSDFEEAANPTHWIPLPVKDTTHAATRHAQQAKEDRAKESKK